MSNEGINHPNAAEHGHVDDAHQQRGRQQGQNTGKEAWKSNLKQNDGQPGEGQRGNRGSGDRKRSGLADTR